MTSKTRHAVIYIPGIGDDYKGLQGFLLSIWRLFGVMPILHEMPWMDQDEYADKHHRLLDRIDQLSSQGFRVSLVGVSAGAGAALNAFAARQEAVAGVVTICGKINRPETIGRAYMQRSPSFIESATQVESSLQTIKNNGNTRRIQSRRAIIDGIVPKDDSYLAGAENKVVFGFGHAVTIILQEVFGAPFFLRWLKMLES